MNLKQLIEKRAKDKKFPKLFRVKLGRGLMVIVALPLGTSLLAPLALAMMIPLKPTLWAKDKIRELKIKRRLR